ncbi:hypothetical protein MUN82_21085 [Hymenobacter aerilatus]|uniref:Anti-sigma factor n=1 Tax=Hymenobacter aerilatus TaxID=2932251 RepID=A0A8T9STE4_9BACT|nr:hypothetical protein [Hymenobacter aerilatus]UOR05408.1 hypothetical protein MUN82_21085 [Hymenobacter aerilatus]
MNKNPNGLEAFVELHRADFDAFEPRPDLWDDLEQALDAPATPAPAPLRIATDEALAQPVAAAIDTPIAETPPMRRRYAWAAACAALLLAGSGYFWKTTTQNNFAWATPPAATSAPSAAPDLSLHMGIEPMAVEASNAPAQRLATAVQRMEAYYATQIQERQGDLHELEAATAATPDADWRQELTALDSTYRQLRVELYRNPEPDVVLDAMNRNLQIRLDILNQQLRTHEQVQAYEEPFALADNHRRK